MLAAALGAVAFGAVVLARAAAGLGSRLLAAVLLEAALAVLFAAAGLALGGFAAVLLLVVRLAAGLSVSRTLPLCGLRHRPTPWSARVAMRNVSGRAKRRRWL